MRQPVKLEGRAVVLPARPKPDPGHAEAARRTFEGGKGRVRPSGGPGRPNRLPAA